MTQSKTKSEKKSSFSNTEERGPTIPIAEIYREHGLRGEVKVYLYNPESEAFKKGQKFYLYKEGFEPKKVTLMRFQPHQKWFLSQFSGIQSIEEARQWRKAEIHIEQSCLPKIENEGFYYFEIIDYDVYDQNNKKVGQIVSFEESGPQTLLKIKTKDAKEALIPFIDEWILSVHHENKILQMDLPEGLLDL